MRNEMHSFAATPEANIPRSRFNLDCNLKFTGNTGDLIPFYVQEVLPGDTFDVKTSIVCRLQTLLHPLMDNIYLDTYYFFVPNRLVWDNWKHFMGEPDHAWASQSNYTVPKIYMAVTLTDFTGADDAAKYQDFISTAFKHSVLDYMGVGIPAGANATGSYGTTYSLILNALPVRAYNKIYDDWFRDENLIDPVNLYTGDSQRQIASKTSWSNPLVGGRVYKACKLHDYFTSALPMAQRGNPVELTTGRSVNGRYALPVATSYAGTAPTVGMFVQDSTDSTKKGSVKATTISNVSALYRSSTDSAPAAGYWPTNLSVDLSQLGLGITINDLRMAFQVQKFMERSARGGSRYIEILKSMFGVTSPDARLQRSEYLGGHRVPVNIHQVVNTAESSAADLGNTAAYSVTSDVHNDFIHSFTEHGFVIGICVVRYKHTYPQGYDRFWTYDTKYDYYWPVFASIGEQPVKEREIYCSLASDEITYNDLVFGYQEAWAQYRYKPNRVMSEMRPGIPNTLASWHLADYYTYHPTLSENWIKEDISPVDRALAVSSSSADQMLFDVMVMNKATRPMPLYSVPGLVDHF